MIGVSTLFVARSKNSPASEIFSVGVMSISAQPNFTLPMSKSFQLLGLFYYRTKGAPCATFYDRAAKRRA